MKNHILARNYCIAGFFGIPWLAFFNVLYFRQTVYGKNQFFDSFLGDSNIVNPPDSDDEDSDSSDASSDDSETDENIIEERRKSREERREARQMAQVSTLTPQEEHAELCKWVKMSTLVSLVWTALLISWIVAYRMLGSTLSHKLRVGWGSLPAYSDW
mmetsp:Transcript_26856/g.53636  ORF Transcript_26856/g.53636 Transcript_26856/m.53636 type:complete len:158 (-) Transcript_26856:102-575(-)